MAGALLEIHGGRGIVVRGQLKFGEELRDIHRNRRH